MNRKPGRPRSLQPKGTLHVAVPIEILALLEAHQAALRAEARNAGQPLSETGLGAVTSRILRDYFCARA